MKFDRIAHKYPWLSSPVFENNIRFAAYDDIAAMKLNAIVGNGTRIKDYIDIAYLADNMTFNQMLKAYQIKYTSNPVMVLKPLYILKILILQNP